MKKIVICLIITISTFFSANSQSIRKNYREMTESEKIDLVNAFYQLRLGADLVTDLADFHRDFFNFDLVGDPSELDIHKNLPDEPEKEIFLAWHRRQMFEMEQAMQDLNPNISLPFVDWTIDNSVDSPVWDQDFMGQFDQDWDLGRDLGSGNLPSSQDVIDLLNFSPDFFLFSNNFERGVVHAGAHNWVGGFMNGSASPRDPIFYLHHTFVDKVWHDWEVIHGNSGFVRSDMIRYDGTYSFDGEVLPLVNPNDIVKSKSLGVFYANNQLAILENYEIQNTYRSTETFYYQFTILLGDNFIIPSDKNCVAESVNEISIKPGFHAKSGSNFNAKITSPFASKSLSQDKLIVRNQIPFDTLEGDFINVYGSSESDELNKKEISVYPNPFINKIILNNLSKEDTYFVQVYDVLGNTISNKKIKNNSSSTFVIDNLDFLRSGLYFITIRNKKGLVLKSKLLKK